MNNYKEDFINNEFKTHCKDYTYVPFIFPAVKKIVVFGDIHGDYKLAVNLLVLTLKLPTLLVSTELTIKLPLVLF